MKPQSEYSKLLKDPKWQKKRLEILSRDEFTCVSCGNDKETLHVHHCYYDKVNMPWEYPDASLITLCHECHKIETDEAFDLKKDLIAAFAKHGVLSNDLKMLIDILSDGDVSETRGEFFLLIHGFIDSFINNKSYRSKILSNLKDELKKDNS